MGNVKLQNVSSATVVISAANIRLRREIAPSRTIMVSAEDYEELTFDNGFQTLVESGFIRVQGDEETASVVKDTVEQKGVVMTKEEVYKMMVVDKDVTKFAKTIPNASTATKETMAAMAIANNLTDPGFTALIKKYCDVDVIEAITKQHAING